MRIYCKITASNNETTFTILFGGQSWVTHYFEQWPVLTIDPLKKTPIMEAASASDRTWTNTSRSVASSSEHDEREVTSQTGRAIKDLSGTRTHSPGGLRDSMLNVGSIPGGDRHNGHYQSLSESWRTPSDWWVSTGNIILRTHGQGPRS